MAQLKHVPAPGGPIKIIRRLSASIEVDPVARCSSCLMRESRPLITSRKCLSSSSTNPIVYDFVHAGKICSKNKEIREAIQPREEKAVAWTEAVRGI